jgi:hypothetical protein
MPTSGQPSAGISRESASEATAPRASTSGVKGITATIRGAPSTPLNIRVAEIKDCRFFAWACLAVFRLFRRSCGADVEAVAFGESLAIRPGTPSAQRCMQVELMHALCGIS